jgi:hypothetical protein
MSEVEVPTSKSPRIPEQHARRVLQQRNLRIRAVGSRSCKQRNSCPSN